MALTAMLQGVSPKRRDLAGSLPSLLSSNRNLFASWARRIGRGILWASKSSRPLILQTFICSDGSVLAPALKEGIARLAR